MEIRKALRVVLKLIACTVGGVVAWLALSVFAPAVNKNAIEGAVLVKAWHCAAFGLFAGIGWAIGYKTGWGSIISAVLLGWSIAIGFQLLRYADAPLPGYLVFFLLILALCLVLTGGGVFRKTKGVE